MKRTTIALDDNLFRELKRRAADEGRSLQTIVGDFVRLGLGRQKRRPFRLRLKGWTGRIQPGVDIADRDKLFDLMDGR